MAAVAVKDDSHVVAESARGVDVAAEAAAVVVSDLDD